MSALAAAAESSTRAVIIAQDGNASCLRQILLYGVVAYGQDGLLAVASLEEMEDNAESKDEEDVKEIEDYGAATDGCLREEHHEGKKNEEDGASAAKRLARRSTASPLPSSPGASHSPKIAASERRNSAGHSNRSARERKVIARVPGAVPRAESDELLDKVGRAHAIPVPARSAEALAAVNHRPFAVKVVELLARDNDTAAAGAAEDTEDARKTFPSLRPELENEIFILRELARDPSPFVVEFYFACQDEERVFIAMELCEGGDMFSLMRQEGRFRPKDILFFAVELGLALQHLHERRIIHGDLKPENVALSSSGHIRLLDFGLAVLLDPSEHLNPRNGRLETVSHSGTLAYCAPEVLGRHPHSFESDWWSYGVMLYEMLYGTLPWCGANDDATCALICSAPIEAPQDAEPVEPTCHDLVVELLAKRRRARIGYEDGLDGISRHSMFRSVRWDHARALRYRPPFSLAANTR